MYRYPVLNNIVPVISKMICFASVAPFSSGSCTYSMVIVFFLKQNLWKCIGIISRI